MEKREERGGEEERISSQYSEQFTLYLVTSTVYVTILLHNNELQQTICYIKYIQKFLTKGQQFQIKELYFRIVFYIKKVKKKNRNF